MRDSDFGGTHVVLYHVLSDSLPDCLLGDRADVFGSDEVFKRSFYFHVGQGLLHVLFRFESQTS